MKLFEIESYKTETGDVPFRAWFDSIKDTKAQTSLIARLDRASFGNFGDWKAIAGAKSLFEMRLHYGQGYRIFYTIVDQKIVLLLIGSTKQAQDKTIAKAKDYLADYNRRIKP
jgi:putative addiction module killer protein